MPEQPQALDCWAIVEQMGHRRFAGYVSEQAFGMAVMIRVDVPETEQPERRLWNGVEPARKTAAYSKLLGVQSIYGITPCTEEVARKAAVVIEASNDPIPVSIPPERQLAAATADVDFQSDDDDDHDDYAPM